MYILDIDSKIIVKDEGDQSGNHIRVFDLGSFGRSGCSTGEAERVNILRSRSNFIFRTYQIFTLFY